MSDKWAMRHVRSLARICRKLTNIPKPGHGRVGEGPDQRGDGEVSGDQHDTVCQGDGNQIARRSKIGDLSQPARAWPANHQHRQRNSRDDDARRSGGAGAHRRELLFIEPRLHELFDELPQTLPASDVDRFDGERIQRPEAALGHAKQRSHSEKPNSEHSHKKQRGPHAKERRCDLVRNQASPRRRQRAVLFRAARREQRTA